VGVQTRSGSGVALDDKGGSGLTWYATGGTWGYRKQITVDPEKVSGSSNLTDFPMLFKVTDADLKHTDHGGKMGKIDATDMLFTSSDGSTKLSHEIEYYASTTGEIIAWVKVPTLYTAQQTPIYVYFGNSGASDQQNVTGVWDSNFKGVWHMPNGTTLSASDSTSNANNGVATNATAASGYIGGAASFDGTDDEILVTRNAGTDDINAKTVSLWVRHNEVAFDHLFGKHSGTNVWNISIDSSNFINFRQVFSGGTATWTSASTVPVSSWTHVVLAYDRTSASNDPTIYINGVASSLGTDTNSTGSANTDASNDIYMGETGNAGSDLNGLLDEVRFSNVIRSSDWIKSEYNNQSSPPTFYSYGALESNSRKNSAGSSESAVKVRGGVKFR
jgi:hypothetical protein